MYSSISGPHAAFPGLSAHGCVRTLASAGTMPPRPSAGTMPPRVRSFRARPTIERATNRAGFKAGLLYLLLVGRSLLQCALFGSGNHGCIYLQSTHAKAVGLLHAHARKKILLLCVHICTKC